MLEMVQILLLVLLATVEVEVEVLVDLSKWWVIPSIWAPL